MCRNLRFTDRVTTVFLPRVVYLLIYLLTVFLLLSYIRKGSFRGYSFPFFLSRVDDLPVRPSSLPLGLGRLSNSYLFYRLLTSTLLLPRPRPSTRTSSSLVSPHSYLDLVPVSLGGKTLTVLSLLQSLQTPFPLPSCKTFNLFKYGTME